MSCAVPDGGSPLSRRFWNIFEISSAVSDTRSSFSWAMLELRSAFLRRGNERKRRDTYLTQRFTSESRDQRNYHFPKHQVWCFSFLCFLCLLFFWTSSSSFSFFFFSFFSFFSFFLFRLLISLLSSSTSSLFPFGAMGKETNNDKEFWVASLKHIEP